MAPGASLEEQESCELKGDCTREVASTCEVNPFEKAFGWPFVLFPAHSFPARPVMIYLTHCSVTFLCRDQPYFEKLRISEIEKLLQDTESCSAHPSCLHPSRRGWGIPREPAWNEAALQAAGGHSLHIGSGDQICPVSYLGMEFQPGDPCCSRWAGLRAWGWLAISSEGSQRLPATTLSPLFLFHISPPSLLNLCHLWAYFCKAVDELRLWGSAVWIGKERKLRIKNR